MHIKRWSKSKTIAPVVGKQNGQNAKLWPETWAKSKIMAQIVGKKKTKMQNYSPQTACQNAKL